MKVTFCMVHLNRRDELIKNLRNTCPYVDRTIIIDGGSEDGSIEWLSSQEAKDLRIEFKVSKQVRLQYGNHTPRERNQYLEMLDTSSDNWVLILDSDEFLQKEAILSIREIAIDAEGKGFNNVGFRAHDLWSYEDGQVYDNLSDYWHHSMFLKSVPGMRYQGETHSVIIRPNISSRSIKSKYEYLHIKSERKMWQSSTYLYWTTAKPAANVTNDPTWLGFHKLMQKYNFLDWHLFNKEMNKGNIPEEIKDWFIMHKDSDNPEERSWFMHYFIFVHPEENLSQVSNRDRAWDYIEQCKVKDV